MSEFFYSLTPDTVLRTIEDSGFEPTGHMLTLNSYENRVYDLKLTDESHIIVKFYRPQRWSEMQIQEEHDFLFELQKDEITVCAPRKFPDGNTIHSVEEIFYAVWERTGGRSADEFSGDDMKSLGRLIARIHNTGAGKKEILRPALNSETYGSQALAFLLDNNFLPHAYARPYSESVHAVCDIYDELAQNIPLHRIHADCHPGNLLHSGQGWFFLDFDDFVSGPAVQDIWMIAGSRDSEGDRRLQQILEGYRQFREFDETWLNLIEPLRALRYIHYSAWIARRWEDPIFKQYFPHFGTEQYWEEETRNLEEQLSVIRRSETASAFFSAEDSSEEKAALTNKDFFWDME